jgi:ubiquinone/menaquinone biosynthesis C-methylase UbiE
VRGSTWNILEMDQLEHCPICNHNSFTPFLVCKDHTVSQGAFHITECRECGFRFTNPRPSAEEIGSYYKAEAYVSHTDSKKGFINSIYHKVRKKTLKQKLKLVTSFAKEQNLLDIGCGTGAFLNECKTNNWKTLGLEPDPDARQMAISNYDLDARPIEELSKLPANSVDVITMWHVLEHVLYLKDDVKQFQRVLKTDGTLIIAVPNCSSQDAATYGALWAAYDVPRHLYHFVPGDMDRLFGDIGMKVVKTLPMKYDAYYVSMLSEKHRGGNLARAFWNGWRSNMAASDSRNDYSSQIYVLQNAE